MDYAVPPIKQDHIHEHTVEQTVALFEPQIKEQIVDVFEALLQECIHEHIAEPNFPRSAVVGSGKRVNLAVTRDEELLAREEEDEYLQVVPQDETMEERQADVYVQRNPEMLEFLMRKQGSL